MLYDLFILELYYGTHDAAQFYEDLSKKYGIPALKKALQAGYVSARFIGVGPDSGRSLLILTDEGRARARAAIF